MRVRLRKRPLFSSLYLGVLFLVAGMAFYRLQHFEGVIVLQKDAVEHLAFRAAARGPGIGLAQRNVPPDLLMLDNPRVPQALRQDQRYDGVVLPVGLRLDVAEIVGEHPPQDWLTITGPETENRIPITAGDSLSLGATHAEVTRIAPWAGLVRTASGHPMAAVSLSPNAGKETPILFLESDRWHILRPDLALRFQWYPNERAFQAALREPVDGAQGARWGVRDGKAVQWFESFAPGTGTRLRDGTEVILAEVDRAAGWVSLRISSGEGTRAARVQANQGTPEAPYLFEDPAATGRLLELRAWREDQALCRLRQEGQPPVERKLAPEERWELPAAALVLQLHQVMATAVAVPGGQVTAVTLRAGETQFTLREGLVETIGDYRVRYDRERPPPDARYQIAVLDAAGVAEATMTLAKGDHARSGAWVFSLAEENPFAPRGVAVNAERRPGGLAQYAGLGLFVLGSFGLVLARFGRANQGELPRN